jgi:hypothetical protein
MNKGMLLSAQIDEEQERDTEHGASPRILDLEWTESEWFEVWLRLAREGQQQNRN